MKLINFDHKSINQRYPSLCVLRSLRVSGFHRPPCTAGGSPRKSAMEVQACPKGHIEFACRLSAACQAQIVNWSPPSLCSVWWQQLGSQGFCLIKCAVGLDDGVLTGFCLSVFSAKTVPAPGAASMHLGHHGFCPDPVCSFWEALTACSSFAGLLIAWELTSSLFSSSSFLSSLLSQFT